MDDRNREQENTQRLMQSLRSDDPEQGLLPFSPLKPTDFSLGSPTNEAGEVSDFGNQFSAFLENQYLTERIILIQQKRRMRSKELHFIDHPLMGVLLQITPSTIMRPSISVMRLAMCVRVDCQQNKSSN